ncbi:MAG: c-type cytochrome [Gammaproteobacteria bacterium]
MTTTRRLAWLTAPACLCFASLALAGGHSGGAPTGDAAAGEKKVAACTACHTPADFAGLSEADLNGAIKKVASGGVAGHPDVGNVSDQDIADLAAFLAKANM